MMNICMIRRTIVYEGKARYIQSAFSIADSEKMIQETRSLKCIPDSFKKVIITKDRTKPWRTDEGILIISLKDFLLDIGSLDL